MTFVVNSPANPSAETPIANGDFWPEIDPEKIRIAYRIDTNITPERLRAELIEAIGSVNGELAAWKQDKLDAGETSLADIEADEVDDVSILVQRYERAVSSFAKAALTEKLRDFDTTNEGHRQADALNPVIDELRRDARWAISAILGIGRSTVELI